MLAAGSTAEMKSDSAAKAAKRRERRVVIGGWGEKRS